MDSFVDITWDTNFSTEYKNKCPFFDRLGSRLIHIVTLPSYVCLIARQW
jgi:hypothetical protein